MKFFKFLICLGFVLKIHFVAAETPSVSVNYLPKKQWKLSKHDMADIKLDIEREVINIFILDEVKNYATAHGLE
jgi:hypothetical protein